MYKFLGTYKKFNLICLIKLLQRIFLYLKKKKISHTIYYFALIVKILCKFFIINGKLVYNVKKYIRIKTLVIL